jgi:hypothetical protein
MIKRSESHSHENASQKQKKWNGHEDNNISQLTRCECQAFLHGMIINIKNDLGGVQAKLEQASSDSKCSKEEQLKHYGRADGLGLALEFLDILDHDFGVFTGFKLEDETVKEDE